MTANCVWSNGGANVAGSGKTNSVGVSVKCMASFIDPNDSAAPPKQSTLMR